MIGRILLIIPFFYLIYELLSIKGYPEDKYDFYFFGFVGLVFLGLVSILFNINKILGVLYVLVGFGCYCYFYDMDIYNLWPVAGLLLLMDSGVVVERVVEKKVSAVSADRKIPKKINKVKKEKINKVSEEKINKVVEVIEEKKDDYWAKFDNRVEKKVEDYWSRYDRRNKKGLLIKLKEEFNKLLGGY